MSFYHIGFSLMLDGIHQAVFCGISISYKHYFKTVVNITETNHVYTIFIKK